MPKDNYSNDSSDDDHGLDPEAEELRKQILKIHKKFTGEDPEPATNNEILQFLRIINYNFISLTRLLQAILLKSVEMDTTLINLELSTVRIDKQLNQFFETGSMLDEIMKDDFNVSGSAADNKFIF